MLAKNVEIVPDAVAAELPVLVRNCGKPAQNAWRDFFDGRLSNDATRRAYQIAVRQFLSWCDNRGLALHEVMAADVGIYIRELDSAPSTKKLKLSALRRFFNLLVERHVCIINPAAVAESPRYDVLEGRTPEITAKQIKTLLASIDESKPIGLRDKAAISTMIYTAARAGAVSRLRVGDYRGEPGSKKLRFREKGGKAREIEVRHDLERLLNRYLEAIGTASAPAGTPLFLSASGKEHQLKTARLKENDMCCMVKRRIKKAGLPGELSAHSFRVATITNLIGQGLPVEDVQVLAGHRDARTTKLYDRTDRKVTRNLVERISL